MPFAHRASGQLIAPGQPFTTTHLKILTAEDASHHQAAAGSVIEHELSHAANALELFGPEDLERYQIDTTPEPAPIAARRRAKAH